MNVTCTGKQGIRNYCSCTCNMAKPKNFTHKELAHIFCLEITRSQECTIYNMKKYRGEKSRSHIVTPIVTVSS